MEEREKLLKITKKMVKTNQYIIIGKQCRKNGDAVVEVSDEDKINCLEKFSREVFEQRVHMGIRIVCLK